MHWRRSWLVNLTVHAFGQIRAGTAIEVAWAGAYPRVRRASVQREGQTQSLRGHAVTVLERTAYQRFKRRPSSKELAEIYTPTAENEVFVRSMARGASPTLTLMVLLKSFGRLGYMPRLQDVPFAIIGHIRSCLRLPSDTALDVTPRTLYRHHQAIREHLQVRGWGPEARHVAVQAAHRAAQVMDHPADLINVAIEELVRERFELPAFGTLDELARHVRAVVHRRLFESVLGHLSMSNAAGLISCWKATSWGAAASTP